MRQIVLQPDGRLAVYSTVVDGLVVFDATLEEIVEEAADFARRTTPCNATPEEAAERIQHVRETTRRNAEHVLAGEPRKAYTHPLSWADIEAMTAETDTC